MKTLALIAVLATVAFAGGMEFGPQIGYWFPTGDAADGSDGSFYFGGQFLSHMAVIAVEGSIGYSSLKASDDAELAAQLLFGTDAELSGHIIPICIGVRSYSGKIYAAGGLELDMISSKIEAGGIDVVDESDSEFGGYIGAGIITPLVGTGDIDVSARLHFIDFDDMWVGIQGGINF